MKLHSQCAKPDTIGKDSITRLYATAEYMQNLHEPWTARNSKEGLVSAKIEDKLGAIRAKKIYITLSKCCSVYSQALGLFIDIQK